MNAPPDVPRTLIDDLLAEQGRLTAVEQFARAHERHEITEPHYRKLLPVAAPRPGEQYAFEVDLDKCSGCQACVTACHSLNGLDDGEAWREVGALYGEAVVTGEAGGQQLSPLHKHVTTACHHCVEPGCLDGCPVLAYDKDPLTGIVRHLDDQCIGCSYCILKCPYDVPQYSAKRGIVRKCDMCHGRLAAGEAPACVQACPNEAIRITVVNQAAVQTEFRGSRREEALTELAEMDQSLLAPAATNGWLPDSPAPGYTLPTTRYVTAKVATTLHSATREVLVPEPAHWPLIWMLLLTQLGVGVFLFGAASAPALDANALRAVSVAGWLTLHAGLGASVLHLGRPMRAWRAFLGWRTSWMSREIIAFGILSALATTATALILVTPSPLAVPALVATALFGLLAVVASAMIYVDTRRPLWRAADTFTRFFSTTLLLGSAGAACIVGWLNWIAGQPPGVAPMLAVAALLTRTCQFVWHHRLLQRGEADAAHPTHRCVRLIRTRYGGLVRARFWLFAVSTLFGLLAIGDVAGTGPVWATISFVSTFTSSLAQRFLFFTASLSTGMPGLR